MILSITTAGIDTVVADLDAMSQRTTTACVRALNRAMASARTVMVREIAKDVGLKSSDVRDALILRNASVGHLEATLSAGLKRIPLIDFNARGPEPSRGKGRGVTYKLQGARSQIPTAFIAMMGSGHRGVFMRHTKARLPIRELFGPSLGRVFFKYRPLGLARLQEAFITNFDHEFQFAGSTPEPAVGTE